MLTLSERLGCSSITFRFQTLFDALESIHAAGLKQVDIACIPGFCDHINPLEFSAQEEQALRDRLNSLGMTVSTLNVSAGGLIQSGKNTSSVSFKAPSIWLNGSAATP